MTHYPAQKPHKPAKDTPNLSSNKKKKELSKFLRIKIQNLGFNSNLEKIEFLKIFGLKTNGLMVL